MIARNLRDIVPSESPGKNDFFKELCVKFVVQLKNIISAGSAKTDPVRFKWGSREQLLKDKFAFFEASKNPLPKMRNLLARRPIFISKKGPAWNAL